VIGLYAGATRVVVSNQGSGIFAEARVIKRGRQLAMIEVEITDAGGRLCAKGRTLYAFRAPESMGTEASR
jgi:acyl-coenzyme A thioesterase PaaI-like protein